MLPEHARRHGHHDDGEIPNYWAYAKAFTLQDHMFEPVASYSLPDHLYMVSGWAARCTPADNADACVSDNNNPGNAAHVGTAGNKPEPPAPEYAWTDITYLLHKHGVSWRSYVAGGKTPDCDDGEMSCDASAQHFESELLERPGSMTSKRTTRSATSSISTSSLDLSGGKLSAVSWLTPSDELSEHPTALVSTGQNYVIHGSSTPHAEPSFVDSTVVFLYVRIGAASTTTSGRFRRQERVRSSCLLHDHQPGQ